MTDFQVITEEEELYAAMNLVEEAIEEASETSSKEEYLVIEIGEISEDNQQYEFVKKRMSGVTGFTESAREINLQVITESTEWKKKIKALASHEYGHSLFFELRGHNEIKYRWERVLLEAHGQNFAEKVFPQIDVDMRKHVSRKELSKIWNEIKENWLSEKNPGRSDPFFHPFGELPTWTGYSLSYYIGQKLLEEYDLEDFPQLEKQDVIEAGDELFHES